MIYRNKNFKVRDFEVTNIVAAVGQDDPKTAPKGDHWEVADPSALKGLTHIYTEAGVKYFGYL